MISNVCNRLFRLFCFAAAMLIAVLGGASANQKIPDQYPGSALYSKPVEVIEGVWSAIGQTGPPAMENAGHNNNLSFVITSDGVMVVNGGASYDLAEALHTEIRKITDQPVKLVVNENGQGHAMLGNSYWREQGVYIIAHAEAADEFEERGDDIIDRMARYTKDVPGRTSLVAPDEVFEDTKVIEVGGTRIELISFGPAHSAGDMTVWLPQHELVITGDMAFHQRLPAIFEDTDTLAWLESWESFAALNAKHVIPGHGGPTDMAEITKYTKDYLIYLRGKVGEVLENGGSLQDAYYVDQTPYAHLDTFKELAVKNAEKVFRQMEFE